MPRELGALLETVEAAAAELMGADETIKSVGIGHDGTGFGFYAVKSKIAIAYGQRGHKAPPPKSFAGVPVHYSTSVFDPISMVRVPHSGPGSPAYGSLIPEQQVYQPLVCGLQIHNFDVDQRSGDLARGFMVVGTLGCFVELTDHSVAILSNNHVVAGENSGQRGTDKILQPGGVAFNQTTVAGLLFEYVDLVEALPGQTIGTVVLNDMDAGIARLDDNVQHHQAYLPIRKALPPKGSGDATLNDKVHKVGRTTGLTSGIVTQLGTLVQVKYDIGVCWFRRTIVIEGENGNTFSDSGDSGSAIVRDSDGAVLGLLFAGNGTQTYACPISAIQAQLNCRVI